MSDETGGREKPDERREGCACGMNPEDLTALAWDCLAAPRRAEVERHASGCPECTAELEALRFTREAASLLGEVAPSEGFHGKLMARVHAAAVVEKATGRRRGPASPEALPSAAMGPASRRLMQIVEREKRTGSFVRPRWKIFVLASSAAACAAFITVGGLVITHEYDPWSLLTGERAASRSDARDVLVRFRERSECARTREAALDDVPGGTSVDLSGMIDDGRVVLTGVSDLTQHERCLMAFRVADWEAYARSHERTTAGPGLERYRVLDRAKQEVVVTEGRLSVPSALVAAHLDGREVLILRLGDRVEIWSRSAYGEYTKHGVPAQIRVELDGVSLAPGREDPQTHTGGESATPAKS